MELNDTTGVRFCLDDKYVLQFVGKQPNWGPVGYVTYKRTYARAVDDSCERITQLAQRHGLKGTEEYWLTVTRVVEGTFTILKRHCVSLRLPWDEDRAQDMAKEMFLLIWKFKFTPPGRGFWMMGTDAVWSKGGACLNNCAFVSTEQLDVDFAAPFCFLMDMSMLGVGVGGDTRGAGKVTIREPVIGPAHVVEDAREGWVRLLARVLNSFVGRDTLPSDIDVSLVRPQGSPIRTFGGTASGPEPLLKLIKDVTELLKKRVDKRIRSCDIVDLFNFVGRCVVSGNVRRSAEIMFGEPTDLSFLELKDPEKNGAALASHRWASNNSVWAEVGQDYEVAASRTSKNGEPGYMWLENAQRYGRMTDSPDNRDRRAAGGNPCLEQTLESHELCCLVETYPAHHRSFDEFKRTLKYAYLYAKAVTLVPTHDLRTNAVLLRNRRIGASMAGVVQAMNRHGRREFFRWCDKGYEYLRKELDEEYSGWLCVPESIKVTSIKPGGTVPLLSGATPGIHYPKSKHYFRVIRFATDSPMVPKLRASNYRCEEIDPAREPNTVACYFAVEEPHFKRSVRDVSMWEQLEMAAQMQAYWADNQVSVTVEFDPTEALHIGHALELYETRLKGVSFLPKSLDGTGFIHAPYQPIDERTYREYVDGLIPLDLSDTGNEVQDKFCDSDRCERPVRKES